MGGASVGGDIDGKVNIFGILVPEAQFHGRRGRQAQCRGLQIVGLLHPCAVRVKPHAVCAVVAGIVGGAIARGAGVVAPFGIHIGNRTLVVVPAHGDGVIHREAVEVLFPREAGDLSAQGGEVNLSGPIAEVLTAAAGAHLGRIVGSLFEAFHSEGVAVGFDRIGLVAVEADLPDRFLAAGCPAQFCRVGTHFIDREVCRIGTGNNKRHLCIIEVPAVCIITLVFEGKLDGLTLVGREIDGVCHPAVCHGYRRPEFGFTAIQKHNRILTITIIIRICIKRPECEFYGRVGIVVIINGQFRHYQVDVAIIAAVGTVRTGMTA